MFRSGKRPSAGATTRLVLFVSIIAGTFLGSAIVAAHSPTDKSVLGSKKGLTYVQEHVTLPNTAPYQAATFIDCPAKTAIAGGGAFVGGDPRSNGAWLNSSSPEPAGGTQTPKKGWIAYAHNNGGLPQTLTAYGICSDEPKTLEYVHQQVTLPGNSGQASALAKCPKHTAVTGGGAFIGGDPDSGGAWINSSSPEPAGGTVAPKKGWIAYAHSNDKNTDQALHVYAICSHKRSKLSYVHQQVTLPTTGSSQASALARCPKHTAVIGGGAFISGDPDRATRGSTAHHPSRPGGPWRRRRAGSPTRSISARSTRLLLRMQSAPSSPPLKGHR